MKNTDYEVQVVVDGKPVKQFAHEGNFWVEARKGKTYSVKVKNNTWNRVLAVVSIDGLDCLSGSPASNESGGYIIPAKGSYEIKGFRTSNEAVNLFEFSNKEQSYAVESPTGEGSSKNCGGIAVRIIAEKRKPVLIRKEYPDWYDYTPPVKPRQPYRLPSPWEPSPYRYDITCKSAGDTSTNWMEQERERGPVMKMMCNSLTTRGISSQKESVSLDMGTKFSDTSVNDKVTYTEFERGEVLEEIAIYYASKEVLAALGITLEPEPKVVLPQLFKGTFCQPPKR